MNATTVFSRAAPCRSQGAAASPDVRVLCSTALELAIDVVGAVRHDQLDDATPCTEFDVRQLLEHLVDVAERVGELGRGEDPYARPTVERFVADDEWLEAFCDAAQEARAAWADDAVLARTIRLPWSELPGAATLAGYVNEITVHTWDLAVATGQRPAWDDKVVALALDAIRQTMPAGNRAAMFETVRAALPAGQADFPAPFAEAVTISAAEPLIRQLVAWNGRPPSTARADGLRQGAPVS